MTDHAYGMQTTLTDITFDEAIERVTTALKGEGFGVLTTIDVKATFKKKLDVDFRPYTILGACNPHLAYQALETEAELGLLLPCNVVIQATEEDTISVSIVDPAAMFTVVNNPALDEAASDAGGRLRRALESLNA